MAWIRVVNQGEAEGELREIYDEQSRQAGAIANILKIHSLRPKILATHLPLYAAIMHAPGSISRAQREMIAVVVSAANGCHY